MMHQDISVSTWDGIFGTGLHPVNALGAAAIADGEKGSLPGTGNYRNHGHAGLLTVLIAMSAPLQDQLSMIERIERALVLLAYFIELDGDVHLPMYEKFEAELEELKQKQATRERAQARLAAYKDAGALKLIR
jgi:hypothetical protein